MLKILSKLMSMASSTLTQQRASKTISCLQFDNKAIRALPLDNEKKNFIRQVPNACFSLVSPTPVKNPRLVACSREAMELIDIDAQELSSNPLVLEYFSGNKIIPGSQTASHCYCGHQFGAFSGQLGDGAAIYLGEVINKSSQRWELQLKGAGPTPYSRHADGRKVLRSSIREFLCSEIMYHMGIPTTRAGTIIVSDTSVIRDKFYDGNAKEERCAVILRMAPTFIRFGSFEICLPENALTGRIGPSVGNSEILPKLLDYVIETFFPELWQTHGGRSGEDLYLSWYKETVTRTAKLVAEWQCIGWCHGVLNTDNMSVCGLTIDYGPFGFMDRFDPDFICNSSDDGGRYTYAKQPEICKWNCEKLAHALKDQMALEDSLKILEETFMPEFDRHYMERMREKLGIVYSVEADDKALVSDFLSTMHKTGADFTNSWRVLTGLPYNFDINEAANELGAQCSSISEIRESLQPSIPPNQLHMMITLIQSNPGFLQQLGRGAMRLVTELNKMEKLEELKNVTEESKTEKDLNAWKKWLERYHLRLSADLNVSTKPNVPLETANSERTGIMSKVNPRFVLRNHIAEEAIELAENNDFSGVQRLLDAFPYVYGTKQQEDSSVDVPSIDEFIHQYEMKLPPATAKNLKVS